MASVAAYRAGELLARHAPAPLALAAARLAALGAAASSSERRLLAKRSVERALGRKLSRIETPKEIAEVFRWSARYYLESFQLPSLGRATIDAGFGHDGFDIVERSVAAGRGTIVVLPHLGPWEWAAWWMALVPRMRVTTVVERIEPPEVFEWFLSFRRRLGINVVPLGPDAARQLAAAVRRGDVVCLLSDRDLPGTGVPVTFLGERTRLPGGPAMLALRTGASLIPAAVYWRDGIRHAVVRPALKCDRRAGVREDVARIVQGYADELAGLIKLAPQQWHMLSPNWPSDYRALGKEIPQPLQGL